MTSGLGQLIRILVLLALITGVAGSSPALAADDSTGAVYTLTNAASGNRVLIFDRAADGTLMAAGSVATGGNGGTLGSQGSLATSGDQRWLYAVNSGSNTISALAIQSNTLSLASVVASGGVAPNSVTAHGDLVYVLNAGGTPNISGFTSRDGVLQPIAGSTRPLGHSNAGAVEIAFSPSGRVLVVSDKAANAIETFVLDDHGIPSSATVFASSGPAPFGFAFSNENTLVFSEAASVPAGSSSASSYAISHDGSITTVSGSVSTTQGAACWLVATRDGRFAYTANAASGSLSLFAITPSSGALSLQQAVAAGGLAHPIDMALTDNNHVLYVLDAGSIVGYRLSADGSLTWISSTPMAGTAGLVAR
ncbi:MAG: lactonase family protein [Deltaproteobacteria bacterium]